MKNIIKSFAHQIDGAILESNVKSNLFSLLVKMIKTSEKNINLDEFKKAFKEIKINYVDNLNLEYYISGENHIYVDKSIFEKSYLLQKSNCQSFCHLISIIEKTF